MLVLTKIEVIAVTKANLSFASLAHTQRSSPASTFVDVEELPFTSAKMLRAVVMLSAL